MKMLEKTDNKMLPTTISGHRRIAKPAIGIQAVSRKGPSRLTRSCSNLYQPMISRYGLFITAMMV